MLWQIRLSVCLLWRACILLRGFNFSGIFLHHIVSVAWPSGNSPTKNREGHPRGSPPTGALNARGNEKFAISYQYLAIARKGYMLLCVWRALNPLFIHVTFTRLSQECTQGGQNVPNRRIWHIAANISLLVYLLYYTAIYIQLENK